MRDVGIEARRRAIGKWNVVFEVAIIYLRNPMPMATPDPHDRPESGARRYFVRFFGFFFGALPCGFGGVLSILRSTSSGVTGGISACFRVMLLGLVLKG